MRHHGYDTGAQGSSLIELKNLADQGEGKAREFLLHRDTDKALRSERGSDQFASGLLFGIDHKACDLNIHMMPWFEEGLVKTSLLAYFFGAWSQCDYRDCH